MAASFLDRLVNGVKEAASGPGLQDLTQKARAGWDRQDNMTKGAIAGGVLAMLLTGGGRRLIGTGLKVGGAAAIGGLAWQAYSDWKAGKDGAAGGEADFLPPGESDREALAMKLLQAMIAAAKADGQITPDERARMTEALPTLGLGAEAEALLLQEIEAPLDLDRLAGLATTEAEAAEIYAASLLAVDPEGAAEKGYLALLAARLKLDPGLVQGLHQQAGRAAA